jgi:quercetin dioxygenase-like cupin family protein
MARYSDADVGELEGEGPGGVVRKTRRALGARAFGFNYFVFPPKIEGHEHDETGSGQEEVMFVVRGSGTLRVDGDEVELRAGRFVRLDPEARRVPVSGEEGLEFLTFGAPVGGGYEPPTWG